MLPVCFTRLAARSSTTVLPPPLNYCLGRCCHFFQRLAARSSTVLPPSTLPLGQMLTVFVLYGWLRDLLLCYPPYTPDWRRFAMLPPYSAPRLNANYFIAMRFGVLGEPLVRYPLHCT